MAFAPTLPRPQALAIVRAARPVRSIAVAPARGNLYGPPHAWICGAPRARGHRR
jgi:hypothetical protein